MIFSFSVVKYPVASATAGMKKRLICCWIHLWLDGFQRDAALESKLTFNVHNFVVASEKDIL